MDSYVNLKHTLLHILDASISMPVLSDRDMELNGETSEFLEKHIAKIIDDPNAKKARFTGEVNTVRDICAAVNDDSNCFPEASKTIANMIFDMMLKNIDIAPADLICCLMDIDNDPFLGILKLNYKSGYTHYINQEEEGTANTIIRYATLLPSDGQKIDEAVLINIKTNDIKIIERAYEINGAKEFYLSQYIINCTTDLSNNQKLKILDKVAQKINKKYYDEDFEKVAKLKKAVAEGVEEHNEIRVENIAKEMFDTNIAVREEYIQEIQKAGLTEEAIQVPEKIVEKKYKTQKIRTDTGIEINFPLSYYDNRDMIEFTTNPDGSISIIIKNISKIINK